MHGACVPGGSGGVGAVVLERARPGVGTSRPAGGALGVRQANPFIRVQGIVGDVAAAVSGPQQAAELGRHLVLHQAPLLLLPLVERTASRDVEDPCPGCADDDHPAAVLISGGGGGGHRNCGCGHENGEEGIFFYFITLFVN